MSRTYEVEAHWDPEAGVWVAESEDIPGLVVEAEQVARTAGFAVRVFSPATFLTVLYSIAASRLRRPFLYDRCFSVAVRRPRR
jgi:hypothetical protein